MTACNDTTSQRYLGRRWAANTLSYNDAAACTRGYRMAEDRARTCPYGHGPVTNARCADMCASGDPICHRSGGPCAIGMMAQAKESCHA